MVDLDQGGVFRQTKRITQGPSLGPIDAPDEVILNISTGGLVQVPLGYSLIRVTTTALVNLQLPSFKGSASGGITLPGTFIPTEIKIEGLSTAPNINILPAGGETLSGLASITLTSPQGVRILHPDVLNGGAIVVQ